MSNGETFVIQQVYQEDSLQKIFCICIELKADKLVGLQASYVLSAFMSCHQCAGTGVRAPGPCRWSRPATRQIEQIDTPERQAVRSARPRWRLRSGRIAVIGRVLNPPRRTRPMTQGRIYALSAGNPRLPADLTRRLAASQLDLALSQHADDLFGPEVPCSHSRIPCFGESLSHQAESFPRAGHGFLSHPSIFDLRFSLDQSN